MNLRIFLPLLVLPVAALAQAAQSSSMQAPMPNVSVHMQSDSRDVAAGFEQAFSRITRLPVTVLIQREGLERSIEGVKSVKASNGVLIIEVGKGMVMLLNARDIVCISEGPLPAARKTGP